LDYTHGFEAFARGARELAATFAPAPDRFATRRLLAADLSPRRVVVRITGGLGNQMFQYAAASAYARRVGLPLRLDLVVYEPAGADREFLLGRLRVPVRRANAVELLWTRRRPHFERSGLFDEFPFENHGSAWLCGFWEDEAHFASVVSMVKRQFVPRDPGVTATVHELVESARKGSGPVVGMHLRRGDRRPGGASYAPFSTLPAEYFRQAAAHFPANANFLVFSDTPEDIAWCREHLGLPQDTNVSFSDGRDPVLDMFALAACDHVILSFGTFSWWAGYLGERPGRRVLAPNPLQARSAGFVLEPPPMAPRPDWEVLTLPPIE
jgi:hypothetical protein